MRLTAAARQGLGLRDHGEHVGVAHDNPPARLLLQDGQRVTGAPDGRPALLGRDDYRQPGPDISPVAQYLDLLDFAAGIDIDPLERRLGRGIPAQVLGQLARPAANRLDQTGIFGGDPGCQASGSFHALRLPELAFLPSKFKKFVDGRI